MNFCVHPLVRPSNFLWVNFLATVSVDFLNQLKTVFILTRGELLRKICCKVILAPFANFEMVDKNENIILLLSQGLARQVGKIVAP
jgi:hypothetical protein